MIFLKPLHNRPSEFVDLVGDRKLRDAPLQFGLIHSSFEAPHMIPSQLHNGKKLARLLDSFCKATLFADANVILRGSRSFLKSELRSVFMRQSSPLILGQI